MDLSQISELASAIMDSWACASGAEIMANAQAPSAEQINKAFAIKQEVSSPPRDPFPGVIPIQQSYAMTPEHVPMDDFDPLETFTFWDGENFYSQQDVCDMQTDVLMPTLSEYLEDEATQDSAFAIKETTLLHNPTLAELNSPGNDTIFDYTLTDSALGAEDSSYNPLLTEAGLSKTFPGAEGSFLSSPISQFSSSGSFVGGLNFAPAASGYIDIKQGNPSSLSSSCPASSRFVLNPQQFLSAVDDKFLQCPQNSPASDSFFAQRMDILDSRNRSPFTPCDIPLSPMHPHSRVQQQDTSLLSSSAPPDITMTTYLPKIKREPPSHSPGPRAISERSLSGFSNLSLSNDDESGSFFDSDNEDDFSSDEDVYQYESDDVLSSSCPTGKDDKSCHHRKHRYFWQYNLQSRGSKTQNILPRREKNDPHVLNDAFDPVFSEECALPVKHSGKARKGDGNDLTPNPIKLFNIGLELKKLNKLIYNINPHETGGSGKPLSRKEKNKLASRVCRLKKKAQHEANKIKLYGLQKEHKKLLTILIEIKELLRYKIQNMQDAKVSNCSKRLEGYLATNEPRKVAGNTAQFVNEILEKMAKGESDGGLGKM